MYKDICQDWWCPVGYKTHHLLVSTQHLWAGIFNSATESSKQLARRHFSRRPKVNKLDMEIFVEDDVLILDVSVKDVQAVKVRYSWHNLWHKHIAYNRHVSHHSPKSEMTQGGKLQQVFKPYNSLMFDEMNYFWDFKPIFGNTNILKNQNLNLKVDFQWKFQKMSDIHAVSHFWCIDYGSTYKCTLCCAVEGSD